MATSLINLVVNLTVGINKIKCNDIDCFLEFESVRKNSEIYKCLTCNKNYWETIDKEPKNRFKNKFRVSNNDIGKFILLLRKSIYPYEYMSDWEKFNETLLH